jgi:hypothetical protein
MSHPGPSKALRHTPETEDQLMTRIERVTQHLINDDHQVDVLHLADGRTIGYDDDGLATPAESGITEALSQ